MTVNQMPSRQFIRYLLVGVINTMVTLVVIFILKSLFKINPYIANAAGYVAGLVNSFIWNRAWVFCSRGGKSGEAIRFVVGFAVCYLLQLFVVWALVNYTALADFLLDLEIAPQSKFTLSGYGLATFAGMAVYTLANFVYNRSVTFRRRSDA